MLLVVEATELPDGLVLKGFLKGDLSCIPLWYPSRREWQGECFKKEDV